ncbi:hypothetical protein V6U90_17000 [Micromonospora sp. CPCC 206060]|uniref:hypothetical protein n=1 Tax=Micromonospora sp. CPCC 206060 TaxID=3122406 RepID=UPI002FF275C5
MTAPSERPRHALLPDRERSHAVLVGSSAGLRHWIFLRQAEEVASQLASALASPGPGGAFHWRNTTLVLGPQRPADILDAVRHAAEAASDVLLFYYAGGGYQHDGEFAFGVTDTDRQHLADTGVSPSTVAGIMSTSQATRPVVILDCYPAVVAPFTSLTPTPTVLTASTSSFQPMGDPFSETLVAGLTRGVQEGPEVLDLVTLQNAIEAAYTQIRYDVENEYIGGPSHVVLHGSHELALGINPAFGRPNGFGALPPNAAFVDEREAW